MRGITRPGQMHVDIHAQPGSMVDGTLSEHTLSFTEIPHGSVLIGSDTDFPDEEPRHVVDVPTFAIGIYPVTNRQYAALLDAMPDTPGSRYWHDGRFNAPNQPVVGISWYEAVVYTDWLTAELSGQLGIRQVARLPSTDEWEKAAAANAIAKTIATQVVVEPGEPLLSADWTKLTRIMTNLLSNAIKFTPAGGQITQIHAHGTAGERGTGLGLAIVQQLVELHGGTIEVASEERRGSTFSVHLPATAGASDKR